MDHANFTGERSRQVFDNWPIAIKIEPTADRKFVCFDRIRYMAPSILTACIATHPPLASAQMDMPGHTMEVVNQTAAADLPVPRKMSGIGNVHVQITATREAQVWFDQGLNLLDDFWDYESARAFEQGVRVDPQCAMCYWGLYKAQAFYHSTSPGYAGQSLAKAVRLKGRASKRERLHIEASEAREESSNPKPGSASKELKIWRELVKDYPQDIQARIFLAGVVDQKEALAIYETIFKEDPDNSAANHFFIHALEAGDHPEQALHRAENFLAWHRFGTYGSYAWAHLFSAGRIRQGRAGVCGVNAGRRALYAGTARSTR